MLLSIRSGELYAVAFTERSLCLSVQRHTLQTTRVVGQTLAILPFNRNVILFLINAFDSRVLSWRNAECLAALGVPHHIAGFVLGSPLAVGASDLLPGDQDLHSVLEVRYLVRILHGIVDRFVDCHPRLVVGGHHERAFRLLRIFMRDSCDTLVPVEDLMHAAAGIEFLHRLSDLPSRELFYNFLERRVFLPHDLVQSSRLDSRFLQLLIRLARFNRLVLACVANEQHAIVFLQAGGGIRSFASCSQGSIRPGCKAVSVHRAPRSFGQDAVATCSI